MSQPLLDLIELMSAQMNIATASHMELTKAVGALVTAVSALSTEQVKIIEAVNRLTVAYCASHAPYQGTAN